MSDSKESCLVCRCEELTEDEIRQAIREGCTTLTAIKRRTRAGMGLCQGRTCQRLILAILAQETGQDVAELVPDTSRFPVRPIRAELVGDLRDGEDS
jgi:NAD(P)H-nitrite reductase large subunit